jgi:AcrR family transcriptional regulator
MGQAVKRQYDSSFRQEQARETRRRIIGAAREKFISQGYGQTTIAQIADAAGVAGETVYGAFRNKATLLRQVWYVDFRGDEEDVTMYDRPEMQAILAEPDLIIRIRRHAEFVTAANRRVGPLLDALIGAAASESGAAAMLAEWADRRLDVATRYAHAAAATGQLAIDEDECRDILFATMDGALWRRLVVERDWTDERYADWLATVWTAQFVKPRRRTRTAKSSRAR